jgi:transposase
MKQKDKVPPPVGRRRYDAEFKASAIRMVEQGKRVSEVAQALGIRRTELHRWLAAAREGQLGNEEGRELAELRARVRQLETERDILKKALSIFSRAT